MKIIEIQPGLWLGDEKSANNYNFIKSNDINNIINCNKYLNYSSHKYNSPVKEQLEKNEIKHTIKFFIKITEYIYSHVKELTNTLIYCHNDLTIAISVIIAFVMRYGKLNKEIVVQLLKSKIASISVSKISNTSLDYFECYLKKEGIII